VEKALNVGDGKVMSAIQGRTVPLRDAERELRRAWMGADEEVRHDRGQGMLRLREINLVVWVDREADAGAARATAARVMRVHPGRVIVLAPREVAGPSCFGTAGGEDPDRKPSAFISTACLRDEESGRQICSEEVVICGTGEPRALQAVTLQLLVPDLPVVTWWLGDVGPSVSRLGWLADASDRVIMDAQSFSDPAQGMQVLSKMLAANRETTRPALTDLSWLRAAPWRKLIAELFEAPERRLLLGDIDRVVVEHDSSLPQALLFGAWFGSRLGFDRARGGWWRERDAWRVRLSPGTEHQRVEDDRRGNEQNAGTTRPKERRTGYGPLLAGPASDIGRSLVLELRRAARGTEAAPGMVGVSVHTNRPAPVEDFEGAQTIYLRRWPHSYSCVACAGGDAADSTLKGLELPPDEDWALLSAAIESRARDRLFEEAARVAGELASLAGAGGPREEQGLS
jgi:hypothetical protein